jgi:hypothetical protein
VRKPEEKHLENPRVDGYNKMNLKRIKQDSVDWIDLAQNRVKWRAVVNTGTNLRVPYRAGNFLTGRESVSWT